jgi:hypothetical protein
VWRSLLPLDDLLVDKCRDMSVVRDTSDLIAGAILQDRDDTFWYFDAAKMSWGEKLEAVAMGLHPRLGGGSIGTCLSILGANTRNVALAWPWSLWKSSKPSCLFVLDDELLRMVAEAYWGVIPDASNSKAMLSDFCRDGSGT